LKAVYGTTGEHQQNVSSRPASWKRLLDGISVAWNRQFKTLHMDVDRTTLIGPPASNEKPGLWVPIVNGTVARDNTITEFRRD